ncbi:MAG TPA: hypothetical protein VHQ39_01140 [Dongiaceae bacterium]|jgi:hypothetical protein|nr:hypothetical protein [Dongiaceae bacterium]
MSETKPAFASIGVMGPAISLAVMALNSWVFKGNIVTDADVTTVINEIAGIVAAVTGIYGRWKATRQVTLTGR